MALTANAVFNLSPSPVPSQKSGSAMGEGVHAALSCVDDPLCARAKFEWCDL